MSNPYAQRTNSNWTSKQAYPLAVICLLLGGAFGYLLRGSSSSANLAAEDAPSGSMPAAAGQQPTPEQTALQEKVRALTS